MVSANSTAKQVLTGLEQGANDYITKPFHRDELTLRICAHVHCTQLSDAELHVRQPDVRVCTGVSPAMLVRAASAAFALLPAAHAARCGGNSGVPSIE